MKLFKKDLKHVFDIEYLKSKNKKIKQKIYIQTQGTLLTHFKY